MMIRAHLHVGLYYSILQFLLFCDTLCVSFCHKSYKVRAHAILVREILPKEMFCVESRVCKLTNWLTLYQRHRSGAPQEKNKTDKADNMTN